VFGGLHSPDPFPKRTRSSPSRARSRRASRPPRRPPCSSTSPASAACGRPAGPRRALLDAAAARAIEAQAALAFSARRRSSSPGRVPGSPSCPRRGGSRPRPAAPRAPSASGKSVSFSSGAGACARSRPRASRPRLPRRALRTRGPSPRASRPRRGRRRLPSRAAPLSGSRRRSSSTGRWSVSSAGLVLLGPRARAALRLFSPRGGRRRPRSPSSSASWTAPTHAPRPPPHSTSGEVRTLAHPCVLSTSGAPRRAGRRILRITARASRRPARAGLSSLSSTPPSPSPERLPR